MAHCCSALQLDLAPLDGLYCSEQDAGCRASDPPYTPLTMSEEPNLSCIHEELSSLLSKQSIGIDVIPELAEARYAAVYWILKVRTRHGFSALTAILSVNYLDRFLSCCSRSQRDNKATWMTQLGAVACLSLAAKVEETSVPLLVDLQGNGGAFFFMAKTIKRMELMILSALQWRMNPVTPLSFIDHFVRRFRFLYQNEHFCHEFIQKCHELSVSVLLDTRMLQFTPSVAAAATMLHVISDMTSFRTLPREVFKSKVLSIFANDKVDLVESCRKIMAEYRSTSANNRAIGSPARPNKRKCDGSSNGGGSNSGSPRGVVDYVNVCSSSESSNGLPPSVPLSSSPAGPSMKKKCRSYDY